MTKQNDNYNLANMLSKAEKEIENLKKTDAFYEWWDAVGSSIRPKNGQDMEEHAKRIALAAWQDRGLLCTT